MKKRKKMNRKKNGKKKTILKKKKKKRNTKILSLNLKEISVLILFETSLVLIPNTGDIIDERRHLWASHLFWHLTFSPLRSKKIERKIHTLRNQKEADGVFSFWVTEKSEDSLWKDRRGPAHWAWKAFLWPWRWGDIF